MTTADRPVTSAWSLEHARHAFASIVPVLGAASLVLTSLAISSCVDTTAPLPVGAVRFDAPPVYARWWNLVESCSGRTADFSAYSWYVASPDAVRAAIHEDAAAYTNVMAHRIVFATSQGNIGGVVRHEMLHALLGRFYSFGTSPVSHPPEYFQGRCAGVVECPEDGCEDAGPAPVLAPMNAPTLPLSALDVQMDVIPRSVSRSAADHAITLIVRVRNPSKSPVWVPLDSTSDLPGSPRQWFGFRIVPANQEVPLLGAPRIDSTGSTSFVAGNRVPFAAGQTRQLVYDWSAKFLSPGSYLAVGYFNTRQVWTPFTVTP